MFKSGEPQKSATLFQSISELPAKALRAGVGKFVPLFLSCQAPGTPDWYIISQDLFWVLSCKAEVWVCVCVCVCVT